MLYLYNNYKIYAIPILALKIQCAFGHQDYLKEQKERKIFILNENSRMSGERNQYYLQIFIQSTPTVGLIQMKGSQKDQIIS